MEKVYAPISGVKRKDRAGGEARGPRLPKRRFARQARGASPSGSQDKLQSGSSEVVVPGEVPSIADPLSHRKVFRDKSVSISLAASSLNDGRGAVPSTQLLKGKNDVA